MEIDKTSQAWWDELWSYGDLPRRKTPRSRAIDRFINDMLPMPCCRRIKAAVSGFMNLARVGGDVVISIRYCPECGRRLIEE
jgi:hypothetical protein